MSENLTTSSGSLPPIHVPVVLPPKVPVVNVGIVRQDTFATPDGKDQSEVIEWEDGATLQVHRPGMGGKPARNGH